MELIRSTESSSQINGYGMEYDLCVDIRWYVISCPIILLSTLLIILISGCHNTLLSSLITPIRLLPYKTI